METVAVWIGIAVGAVTLAGAGVKLFLWLGTRAGAKRVGAEALARQEREARRATEDLERELKALAREESAAYDAVDEDLNARGVLRSGMRGTRYLEIAEEYDRRRGDLLTKWHRRIEDLGIQIPQPPPAATTLPLHFDRDGMTYDRMPNPPDEPIRCGWCGRLVYLAGDREGVSWWCPEHEFKVS
jgi:hypothetical protein